MGVLGPSHLHQHTMWGRRLPVSLRTFATPMRIAATAPLGGGLGTRRHWWNAQVPGDYAGDVDADVAAIARCLGVDPTLAVGMLTAVDVRDEWCATDGGVEVVSTVGVTHPAWAAADDADAGGAAVAGTINILVVVPARLADAALVNAACTATEAKAQALIEAGIPGTGTASDAIAVAARLDGEPHPYGGPRSEWGARVARAVHAAVRAGLAGRPGAGR